MRGVRDKEDTPQVRQENRVPLVGNCGDFGAGPDMVTVHSRVYPRIGLARFRRAGRRPCTDTISDHRNSHPSSCRLQDAGSFSPSPVRDCTSLVHPVRDYMHLNEDRKYSGLRHTDTMKSTRHTSSRRIKRRNEREQRVLAGAPTATLDWRCPLCLEWYSNFCGRNILHLRHCEGKQAERAALEERRRAQTPLPSPDYFSPHSTPDLASIPQSPNLSQAGPSTAGGDRQDWYDDPPEPPTLGEAQVDGPTPGESNAASQPLNCEHAQLTVYPRWGKSRQRTKRFCTRPRS